MTTAHTIRRIYEILQEAFGPQHWWPGETPFEVMVGAVLTQNTNWQNVEKAIANLKQRDLFSPDALHRLPVRELAELIRPAGYFNVKAKRLANLVHWLVEQFDGDLDRLFALSVDEMRERLIRVNGIGLETCDSIVLYAAGKPTFVVDAYTARVLRRHGLIDRSSSYEEIKELFEDSLGRDVRMYNEYHALLVQVGKRFCRKKPLCDACPLSVLFQNGIPSTFDEE